MKKYLSLLALLVIVSFSFSLSGCGGKKDTAGQPSGEPPKSEQTAKEEPLADLLAKGKKIEGMSYDYSIASKEITTSGKVWLSDKKVKSESTVNGTKLISIFDGGSNTVITYYPEQNKAMKISTGNTDNTAETPTEYAGDIDASKAKVLETTVYDGARCKVIQVENPGGKEKSKMWIREDYGIPVKVEITSSDGTQMVMEYKNLKIGKQPAEVFELPAGVVVTDMGDMMKNLPQMPGVKQ
ncbi:MAG: LolA family protein [Eubacteriales bacterium]